MPSERLTKTVGQLEAESVLVVQDGNHGAYRPRKEEIVSTGIAHIRAADISDLGTIDFEGSQRVAMTAWDRIKKGRAQANDVLLTHKGTVGRVALVPRHVERFLCSPQTTFWRSINPEVLDQRYLHALLRSPQFQEQLSRVMDESDMAPYVSLTNQRRFALNLPAISEQRAIASVPRVPRRKDREQPATCLNDMGGAPGAV